MVELVFTYLVICRLNIHLTLCSMENVIPKHLSKCFFTCILQVSISSAERMLKEGGKPGERSPSKKGKEKGKEAKEVSTAALEK